MRRLAIIGAFAALSACGASVESDHPLFATGADRFKDGMWAAVPQDRPCDLPKDAAIFTWPDCAAPILIHDGVATYFTPNHVRVGFIVADGDPRILQTDRDFLAALNGAPDEADGPVPDRRFYASFYPASAAPFTDGRIQFLVCSAVETQPIMERRGKRRKEPVSPEPSAIPGLRRVQISEKTHCIADTPDAVRDVARRASPDDASMRLVWIAAYP